MVGVQIPILLGIFEYGIILAMKKYQSGQGTSVMSMKMVHHEKDEKIDWNVLSKTLDKWTFIGASVFIVTFNIIYWSVVLNIH